MSIKIRPAILLIAIVTLCGAMSAQERVSLKPVFTAGQESRYNIAATVETTITPSGANGIAANSRRELTATVVVRTVVVSESGEAAQEATVEAISLSSAKGGAGAAQEQAGKKIEFTIKSKGELLKCSIPNSAGYQAVADLLFSTMGWYPSGDVSVGGSWKVDGHGPIYTDRLSSISRGAKTTYNLASVIKGVGSIEGTITLNANGTSALNAEGAPDIAVIADGKGTSRFDFDAVGGRLVGAVTESRLEGKVSFTRPTAAGEKLQPREGTLVETSNFSIKLIQ